jgi:hypothetical protein
LTVIDWIEVSRIAHQLGLDHGRGAFLYAAKIAADAKHDGKVEDAEFWNAVASSLAPRSSGQA